MHYLATFAIGLATVLLCLAFFFVVGHLSTREGRTDYYGYSIPAHHKMMDGCAITAFGGALLAVVYVAGVMVLGIFCK